jgi:hypothetical protein
MEYVTKDEFKKMEDKVNSIDTKVGRINDSLIRLESNLENLPNKILADLPSKLYNNCTRIAIVEKTIDGVKDKVNKIEGNISWVTKTILGIVITTIMGIIVAIR